jgi:hypothetical protein
MAAELVQIIYDDKQKVHCFPFSKLHYNESLTIYFENDIIKNLVLETKADKIGVCSWKLKEKLRWYIGQRRELTQELLETDYEVMTFTRNTKYHKFYAAADAWHPGFLVAFDKILAKIGVSRPWEVKIPIYQNHFSAKAEIYRDYVKSYLIPAMDCIKNDPEVNKLALTNSNYSTLTNSTITADYLQERIGVPYFPLAPFLLERLFATYVHNKKINVTYL